jgi:hypothetical protein
VPRFDGSDPRQSTSGWVRDKFVQWFECPDDFTEGKRP